VPGVRTSDPKTNGCPPPPPEPPPPADRDGDGITDDVDACPDVPGPRNDDPAKNGCPPPAPPPDRDGDKIPDSVDACPDVPGVASEDPTKNGCPPDRDGDGIIDAEDACPDAPGPDDPDPKKKGCPLARIEGDQVRITEQVRFKTDSADILGDSEPVLLAVAVLLKNHPEITRVRIEGHTDNRGRATYNKELSKKRAASVVKWLVTKGIDKSRLVSNGYGLERPLVGNDTEEGRQANRRVEFHIEATGPAAAPPSH
jgi:outer membrane protein OmpA-like peptidoglycan-associated protein